MELEFISGGNTFWRKEILLRYGYDKNLLGYGYGDDVDLSYRVSRSYPLFYEPKSVCFTEEHPQKGERLRRYRRVWIENFHYFALKNGVNRFYFYWCALGHFFRDLICLDLKGVLGDLEGLLRVFLKRSLSNQVQRKNPEVGIAPIIPRARFLKEYIDAIAGIGKRLNSPSWWSSWISSKNRFSSQTYLEMEKGGLQGDLSKLRAPSHLGIFIVFLKTLKSAALHFSRITYAKFLFFGSTLPTGCYVIRTFSYAHSFSNQTFKDPFFSGLRSLLETQGKKTLTVFDAIGDYGKPFLQAKRIKDTIPFEAFVGYFDLLHALFEMVKGFFSRFPSEVEFEKGNLAKVLKAHFKSDSLSPGALHAHLHRFAFRRIADSFKPTAVLHTAEGNPWEKLLYLGVKEGHKPAQVLGYQHSVVPQASISMFPGIGEAEFAPLPDRILVSGEVPYSVLNQYGKFKPGQLQIACSVRYEYLHQVKPRTSPLKKTLLIALEGVNQASQFLDSILKAKLPASGWRVVVRAHPALPVPELKKLLSEPAIDWAGVEVSKNVDLKKDFEEASVVAYWGSTVGLEAIAQGIPVIHCDLGGILSYDPIETGPYLHWTKGITDSWQEVLEKPMSLSEPELSRHRTEARKWLESYFHPITNEGIRPFLV